MPISLWYLHLMVAQYTTSELGNSICLRHSFISHKVDLNLFLDFLRSCGRFSELPFHIGTKSFRIASNPDPALTRLRIRIFGQQKIFLILLIILLSLLILHVLLDHYVQCTYDIIKWVHYENLWHMQECLEKRHWSIKQNFKRTHLNSFFSTFQRSSIHPKQTAQIR